jgi:hypothetical protein
MQFACLARAQQFPTTVDPARWAWSFDVKSNLVKLFAADSSLASPKTCQPNGRPNLSVLPCIASSM